MTAPRWIAEAIEATSTLVPNGYDALATALIERLPIEAMAAAGCQAIIDGGHSSPQEAAAALIGGVVRVLTESDPEVVTLTELYQGACRVLDAAGVPYADPGSHDAGGPPPLLDLTARIRWLAQQRPTRLDLQRVEDERDEANRRLQPFIDERDGAYAANQALRDERDQLQAMYEGASDDLDRERSAHQEAEAAAANREIALTVDLETARAERDRGSGEVARLRDGIEGIVDDDWMTSGEMRRRLASLTGDHTIGVVPETNRQALRRQVAEKSAKIIEQAAYIEQLETEISALEDEIDTSADHLWNSCEVGS